MRIRSTASRDQPGSALLPPESTAGVTPTRTCARCGSGVRWREAKFCLDRRPRFGGRVFCQGCQRQFEQA
jgi:hypothetical protein